MEYVDPEKKDLYEVRIKISPRLKSTLNELAKGRNISDFIKEIIEEKVKVLSKKQLDKMNIIEAMEKKRILETEVKELGLLIKKLTQEETIKILKERMRRIKKLVGGK